MSGSSIFPLQSSVGVCASPSGVSNDDVCAGSSLTSVIERWCSSDESSWLNDGSHSSQSDGSSTAGSFMLSVLFTDCSSVRSVRSWVAGDDISVVQKESVGVGEGNHGSAESGKMLAFAVSVLCVSSSELVGRVSSSVGCADQMMRGVLKFSRHHLPSAIAWIWFESCSG